MWCCDDRHNTTMLALVPTNDDRTLLQELEDLEHLDTAETRARLRGQGSLLGFVEHFWDEVEPTNKFVGNWHIWELCKILEASHRGEEWALRLIINVPPGTLKSLIVSVFFPAWCWAQNPKLRFLTASYSANLSTRDSLRMRNLVQSAEFQRLFPLNLADDQNAKTRYNTTSGGWRFSTSVDGAGTGEHPHYIIIDDPHSAAQAESDAERKAAIAWVDRTISSRGANELTNVRIIVIMQRLHELDLTGHLLAKGGWHHVCWPMRYMKARPKTHAAPAYTPDPRDPRTTEGELLIPTVFSERKVQQLERDLGPFAAAGQLQQQPAPEGGGLFARENWRFIGADTRTGRRGRRVRAWDTAATAGAGDYTVGVLICEEWEDRPDPDPKRAGRLLYQPTGRYFIESVVRGQWGPDDVDRIILETAKMDGKRVAIREQREGGASGKSTIAARRTLLKGYDYDEVLLGTNKVQRSKPLRSQQAGNNVYLEEADWNAVFVDEAAIFPLGRNDDQVDAASTAFETVILEPVPEYNALEGKLVL